MFCSPRLDFDGKGGIGSYFRVLRDRTHFGGSEDVGSRFHVLRSRTRLRRYRGSRVPFSCFVPPDSFSAVPSVSGPVFMFCAPELIYGGTNGVGSLFHVLNSWSRFRRYRVRRVPFSRFARSDSFSAVPGASGLIYLFCSPGLVFGGTKGVPSRFHVIRSRTCFRRYEGRRVPFSCFSLPDSFSTVPRASGPVFTFCVPGLVFGGNGSRFLILCALTRFRLFQGCRVPFSCFALPDSFTAVPMA
jgi:hypothetical protein